VKRAGLLAIIVALVIAGCAAIGGGGGGSAIDKGKLEAGITQQTNAQLAARGTGVRVTATTCVQHGDDDYAFSCLLDLSNGEKANMEATCDPSGSCVWKEG
jgi:hypothetical protein